MNSLSIQKKDWALLALLMLAGLFVRSAFLAKVKVVLPDEAFYIRFAEHLAGGRGFGEFETFSVRKNGQPLVPYLFAGALRAARDLPAIPLCEGLSALFGVLSLIPFYFTARRLGDTEEAAWSGFLYAFAPFTLGYSLWAMQHSFFNFFLLCSLGFILKTQSSLRPLHALSAGFMLCLAYMTRVEGIIFGAALAAAGFFLPWTGGTSHGRRIFLTLCFCAGLVLPSIPFWIWVKQGIGSWQITWTNRDWSSAGIFFDQWGGLSNGTGFSLRAFLWGYAQKLENVHSLLPRVLPILCWVLIAFGAAGILDRDPAMKRPVLTIFFFAGFPLFFYPLYGSNDLRYYSPAIVFFLLFSGAGLALMRHKVFEIFRLRVPRAVFFFAGLLLFLPGYASQLVTFKEEPLEQKAMGEWIRGHVETPQILFSSDRRACFYAGPKCLKVIPVQKGAAFLAGGGTFEDFLRQSKIRLIAADTRYILKYNPQFAFLLRTLPAAYHKKAELTRDHETITLYEWAEI